MADVFCTSVVVRARNIVRLTSSPARGSRPGHPLKALTGTKDKRLLPSFIIRSLTSPMITQ